jgi:hypothetical protein
MSLQLTGNEVAVGASVVVFVGALLTYHAARYSTRESLKTQERVAALTIAAQRDLASDERLWQQRTKIYTEVIDLIHKHQPMARGSDEAINVLPDDLAVASRYASALMKTTPGIAAFAERATFKAWEAMVGEAHDLSLIAVRYRFTVQPMGDSKFDWNNKEDREELKTVTADFNASLKRVKELTGELLACVRQSLQRLPTIADATIRPDALTYGNPRLPDVTPQQSPRAE